MNVKYTQIKEDVKSVIEYSQNIIDPDVDRLMDNWESAKRYIIDAFGGELIYEVKRPVTFDLSQEAKELRVQNFIDMCYDSGYDDLGRFIDNEKEGFFENKCVKDYEEVKKGTKLLRAFKYFVDNKKALDNFQSKASQLIQENKVVGKLCFSVHPLDFLSLSENTYNWRSCHALDGEYRAGNLTYMMDNSTIICYLKGEENVKLPHFPDGVLWNSKKWRVLFFLSNDWKMIFAGKQYPFSTTDGMNMIIDKFFNADPECGYRKPHESMGRWKNTKWTHWLDYKIPKMNIGEKVGQEIYCEPYSDFIPLGNGIIDIEQLVTDEPGSQHFNDVTNSSCYSPMYTFLAERATWWGSGNELYPFATVGHTRFNIGAHGYCLRCGSTNVMDAGSSTMMCYECESKYGDSDDGLFGRCSRCQDRILIDDGYYIQDDLYCEDCFQQNAEKCERCGDYYLTEDMIYDEELDEYYCKWCIQEIEKRRGGRTYG